MEHLQHPKIFAFETRNWKLFTKKLNAKVLFSCSPETRWSARSLCSNWCQIQIRRQNLRLERLHTVRRNCSSIFKHNGEEIKILSTKQSEAFPNSSNTLQSWKLNQFEQFMKVPNPCECLFESIPFRIPLFLVCIDVRQWSASKLLKRI